VPPRSIEIVDDPELVAFGRHAVDRLGISGIVHLDTVRDSEGRYWLLDVNIRAWGSMVVCRGAGVDFGQGYLFALGLRDAPPVARTGTPGVVVSVFPSVLGRHVRSGRFLRGLASFARHSGAYLRWLGFSYWLSELLACVRALAGGMLRRRAVRRPGAAKAGHAAAGRDHG
jgi:hypothetical protein